MTERVRLAQLCTLAQVDQFVLDYGRTDGRVVIAPGLVRRWRIDAFVSEGDDSDTLGGFFVRRAVLAILGACARDMPLKDPRVIEWTPNETACFAAMKAVHEDWELGDYVLGLVAFGGDSVHQASVVRNWVRETFV